MYISLFLPMVTSHPTVGSIIARIQTFHSYWDAIPVCPYPSLPPGLFSVSHVLDAHGLWSSLKQPRWRSFALWVPTYSRTIFQRALLFYSTLKISQHVCHSANTMLTQLPHLNNKSWNWVSWFLSLYSFKNDLSCSSSFVCISVCISAMLQQSWVCVCDIYILFEAGVVVYACNPTLSQEDHKFRTGLKARWAFQKWHCLKSKKGWG